MVFAVDQVSDQISAMEFRCHYGHRPSVLRDGQWLDFVMSGFQPVSKDYVDIHLDNDQLIILLHEAPTDILDEELDQSIRRQLMNKKYEISRQADYVEHDETADNYFDFFWYLTLVGLMVMYALAIVTAILSFGVTLPAILSISQYLYTSILVTPVFLGLMTLYGYSDIRSRYVKSSEGYKVLCLDQLLRQPSMVEVARVLRAAYIKDQCKVERMSLAKIGHVKYETDVIVQLPRHDPTVYGHTNSDAKILGFLCYDDQNQPMLSEYYLLPLKGDDAKNGKYLECRMADDGTIHTTVLNSGEDRSIIIDALYNGDEIDEYGSPLNHEECVTYRISRGRQTSAGVSGYYGALIDKLAAGNRLEVKSSDGKSVKLFNRSGQ